MSTEIITCIHDNSGDCLYQINGDIDKSLLESKGYFYSKNYSKPILNIQSASFALDNIEIYSDDNSDIIIFGRDASILLIDATISSNLVYQ